VIFMNYAIGAVAPLDQEMVLWGFRTRPLVLTWALCGALVFTAETAEDGPTH